MGHIRYIQPHDLLGLQLFEGFPQRSGNEQRGQSIHRQTSFSLVSFDCGALVRGIQWHVLGGTAHDERLASLRHFERGAATRAASIMVACSHKARSMHTQPWAAAGQRRRRLDEEQPNGFATGSGAGGRAAAVRVRGDLQLTRCAVRPKEVRTHRKQLQADQ